MRHQSLWQRRKGRLPAWIPSQKNVLHFSLLSLGYHAGLLCFCGQCCSSLCPRVPVGGCCPVPTLVPLLPLLPHALTQPPLLGVLEQQFLSLEGAASTLLFLWFILSGAFWLTTAPCLFLLQK